MKKNYCIYNTEGVLVKKISTNIDPRVKLEEGYTAVEVENLDDYQFEKLPIDETADLMFNIRQQRNLLLQQSDWTVAEDSPVDKEAWKIYRQALRDLTENIVDPTNVTWPEQP